MSVREEDKNKNSCPSRGLGLAAAAIGVGVGAAVYYFLSKRPEQPDSAGSTSEAWRISRLAEQNLSNGQNNESTSYYTVSEHSTTDTSMNEDSFSNASSISREEDFNSDGNSDWDDDEPVEVDPDSEMSSNCEYEDSDAENSEIESWSHPESDNSITLSLSGSYENVTSAPSPSLSPNVPPLGDLMDELNRQSQTLARLFVATTRSPFGVNVITTRNKPAPATASEAFRQRSWSLEECPICFEIMLDKEETLMALPCTHKFHVSCIGPWLEQHQTCPVCRKNVA